MSVENMENNGSNGESLGEMCASLIYGQYYIPADDNPVVQMPVKAVHYHT